MVAQSEGNSQASGAKKRDRVSHPVPRFEHPPAERRYLRAFAADFFAVFFAAALRAGRFAAARFAGFRLAAAFRFGAAFRTAFAFFTTLRTALRALAVALVAALRTRFAAFNTFFFTPAVLRFVLFATTHLAE